MFSNNLRALLAASALLAAPLAASAQTVAEGDDAGETLATAQVIAGGVGRITGAFENLGSVDAPIDDVDLYRITIVNPAAFGVTAEVDISHISIPDDGLNDDTMLFLFDASGVQVGFNDDEPNASGTYPVFAVGDFAGLAPGSYYLGFDVFNTRSILSGGVLAGWDRTYAFPGFGTYALNLTGTGGGAALPDDPVAGVPEPATWALMILGFGAAGSTLRRAQRRRRALLPA